MSVNPTPLSAKRLERISAQLERLESRESEWAMDLIPPRQETGAGYRTAMPLRLTSLQNQNGDPWWDHREFGVILKSWGDRIERLAGEMQQQAKSPFSLRTQQISVLCAFIPFVLAILTAGVILMPRLPTLTLWEKITYFIALPIFLAMAGALAGFVIGVMLDSMERQADLRTSQKSKGPVDHDESPSSSSMAGVKGSVWVSVEDLEPNQRVAETVLGADGSPLLLKHTLLKPTHIELLRNQNVDRVKVEVLKYPAEGEMAMAG